MLSPAATAVVCQHGINRDSSLRSIGVGHFVLGSAPISLLSIPKTISIYQLNKELVRSEQNKSSVHLSSTYGTFRDDSSDGHNPGLGWGHRTQGRQPLSLMETLVVLQVEKKSFEAFHSLASLARLQHGCRHFNELPDQLGPAERATRIPRINASAPRTEKLCRDEDANANSIQINNKYHGGVPSGDEWVFRIS